MLKGKSKFLAIACVVIFLVGVCSLAFADTSVQAVSSLNGTVAADGLVQAGASVSEGQVLVNVKTIAGLMPAARATASGKVASVLVTPGQTVTSGQAVVIISVSGK